jgi:hypothetical protein
VTEASSTRSRTTSTAPALSTSVERDELTPRYFGVTPHGLAAVVAAFAFGAGTVLLGSGYIVAGVLLLVAAALLATIYAEQARRRRDSAFDRIAATAVDHTRALAGFTGSSVRAWSRAGRELARLRLEANRRAKERRQLQYALGAAAYTGDDAETERLRAELRAVDDRLAACVTEANEAVERMRAARARDRLAVVATEVRGPTDGPTDAA